MTTYLIQTALLLLVAFLLGWLLGKIIRSLLCRRQPQPAQFDGYGDESYTPRQVHEPKYGLPENRDPNRKPHLSLATAGAGAVATAGGVAAGAKPFADDPDANEPALNTTKPDIDPPEAPPPDAYTFKKPETKFESAEINAPDLDGDLKAPSPEWPEINKPGINTGLQTSALDTPDVKAPEMSLSTPDIQLPEVNTTTTDISHDQPAQDTPPPGTEANEPDIPRIPGLKVSDFSPQDVQSKTDLSTVDAPDIETGSSELKTEQSDNTPGAGTLLAGAAATIGAGVAAAKSGLLERETDSNTDAERSELQTPDIDIETKPPAVSDIDIETQAPAVSDIDIETQAPAVSDIDISTDINTPDTETDIELPATNLPKVEVPDSDLPKVENTDVNLPRVEIQDADLPKAELPDANLPEVKIPDHDLPAADTLDSARPEVETPDGDGPEVDIGHTEADESQHQTDKKGLSVGEVLTGAAATVGAGVAAAKSGLFDADDTDGHTPADTPAKPDLSDSASGEHTSYDSGTTEETNRTNSDKSPEPSASTETVEEDTQTDNITAPLLPTIKLPKTVVTEAESKAEAAESHQEKMDQTELTDTIEQPEAEALQATDTASSTGTAEDDSPDTALMAASVSAAAGVGGAVSSALAVADGTTAANNTPEYPETETTDEASAEARQTVINNSELMQKIRAEMQQQSQQQGRNVRVFGDVCYDCGQLGFDEQIVLPARQYDKLGKIHCGVTRPGFVAVGGDVSTIIEGQILLFMRHNIAVCRNGDQHTFAVIS